MYLGQTPGGWADANMVRGGTNKINTNTWYVLVGVWERKNGPCRVYIDGKGGSTGHNCNNGDSNGGRRRKNRQGNARYLPAEKVIIGGRNTNDGHNPGNIDVSHVLVYDRALTQNEISSLKDAMEGTATSTASAAPVFGSAPPPPAIAKNGASPTVDENKRKYSSVHLNDKPGNGHARSKLDSPQAWSAAKNAIGQWAQLDLGSVKAVYAVVMKPRTGNTNSQRVKSYTVKVSTDEITWTWVAGPGVGTCGTCFAGNTEGENADTEVDGTFSSSVNARYVQVWPETWLGHISMRFDVKTDYQNALPNEIDETEAPSFSTDNPSEGDRSYSSVLASTYRGGYAQSMLNSPQSWVANVGDGVGSWAQLDLGSVKTVGAVVTQARAPLPGNQAQKHGVCRVNSYKVMVSVSEPVWTNVDNGATFNGNPPGGASSANTEVVSWFASPVSARRVRLVVQTFSGSGLPQMRWGVKSASSSVSSLPSSSSAGWVEIGHQYDAGSNLFESQDFSDYKTKQIGSVGGPKYMNVAQPQGLDGGLYKFKIEWWLRPNAAKAPNDDANRVIEWKQARWVTSTEALDTIAAANCISVTGNDAGDPKDCASGLMSSERNFMGYATSHNWQCMMDGNGNRGSWWNCAGVRSTYGGGVPCYNGKVCDSFRLSVWTR